MLLKASILTFITSLLSISLAYCILSNRPIAFTIILIIEIIVTIMIFYKMNWLELTHKNLFQQPLFWLSIGIPIYLFLFIGSWSWRGHAINFSADGFNTFLTISKLPLLLLASSVPLTSIVNNIHRTIQTEKQITEAETKSLSDAYYNHFKHTLDLLSAIESKEIKNDHNGDKHTLKVSSPVTLYHKIFRDSNAKNGANYIPNTQFIENILKQWKTIHTALDNLFFYSYSMHPSRRTAIGSLNSLYKLEKTYEFLCRDLTLNSLLFERRPVYKLEHIDYTGLFFDINHLVFAVKELNYVCTRIIDIINPENIEHIKDELMFTRSPTFKMSMVRQESNTHSLLNKVRLYKRKGSPPTATSN